MTNKKQKYYCAWHPEHDFVAETTAQTESMSWEFLVTPDLPRKSVDIKQRIDDQIKRHKSYGWQVKEVEIVEKYSEGKYGCIDDYLKMRSIAKLHNLIIRELIYTNEEEHSTTEQS